MVCNAGKYMSVVKRGMALITTNKANVPVLPHTSCSTFKLKTPNYERGIDLSM
jgi:hypothetical protein